MKTILVVDDDQNFSSIISSVLQYAGYNVLIAQTSQDSIEIAQTKNPDLILMDIMMPDMDGADVTKALKSSAKTRGIPIVFLTGLVSSEEDGGLTHEGLKIEHTHYPVLVKPFENEHLLRIIKDLLKNDDIR